VHFDATEDEIKEAFKDIEIIKIIPAREKKGIFDVQVSTKDEAIKLIERGNGRIKGRPFYVRLSYVNKFEPSYPPRVHKPHKHQEGEDSPNQKRYKQKKNYYSENEQPEYNSPYKPKKHNQTVQKYYIKTHHEENVIEEAKGEPHSEQNQNATKFKAPSGEASPIKFFNAKKNKDKDDATTPSKNDGTHTPISNFEQDRTPIGTPNIESSNNLESETKTEEQTNDQNFQDKQQQHRKSHKKDQQQFYKPPQRREVQAMQYRAVYVEKNGASGGDSPNYNSPDMPPKMHSQEEIKADYQKPSKYKYNKPYDQKYEEEYDRAGNKYDNRTENRTENRTDNRYPPKKSYSKFDHQHKKVSYVPKTETPDRELNRPASTGLKDDKPSSLPSLSDKKKSTEQPKPINNKKSNIFDVLNK